MFLSSHVLKGPYLIPSGLKGREKKGGKLLVHILFLGTLHVCKVLSSFMRTLLCRQLYTQNILGKRERGILGADRGGSSTRNFYSLNWRQIMDEGLFSQIEISS